MRDCVRTAFKNGSKRGHEFKKMRHAIIVELKRLGFTSSEIKDKLLEWNKRCERILPPSEQKRQLLNYVEWTDKHQCWLGCKGLEDFCIGQNKCLFYKKKTYMNRKQVKRTPFDFNRAKRFLEKRYRAEGYVMSLILDCLRQVQIEKTTGETILIGYRAISSFISHHYGHRIDPMTVYRRMQDLISEGMVEVVVKGKKGQFGKPANGYRFLNWKEHVHPGKATTHNNLNV